MNRAALTRTIRNWASSTLPKDLLFSIVFYAAAAMLSFGAFLMRYRIELVLSFPLIAIVMAMYLSLAFKPDSPADHP
ncbi:MAG: hypothetical protein WA354_03120 [Terracidiphilus sp.]